MVVEVLNTGTELLLGDVTNTHLTYLGTELLPLGLRISRQTTVPDGDAIRTAMAETFGRCDILLVTGGLGPTTDDITREATAELLGLPLHEDAHVVAAITERLEKRGYVFRERMRRQAMVPEGALVLTNRNGTAPGLYLPALKTTTRNTPHIFLLPGPPHELRPMFEAEVLPILRGLLGGVPVRERRVYHIVGMGESAVEEIIGFALTQRGDIEVGYCARPNEVDLRLIGPPQILGEVEPSILSAVGKCLVSSKGEKLEGWLVEALRERGQTVAFAESCTGGLMANRLTNVPGASEVFREGYVVYANSAKEHLLGVSSELLRLHGAVSADVAAAMAQGALSSAEADYALAVTGIAGPGGGSIEKPVGTVFIALARQSGPTVVEKHFFPVEREIFKLLVTQSAFDLLRQALLEN